MAKVYEYNGKHYCNKNISETDDKYGGNLHDLYLTATDNELDGVLCEQTVYYNVYDPTTLYGDVDELIEQYFEDDVIGEV